MNARARETCAQDRFIVSSPSCNFGHLVTGGGFFVTDAPQPSLIVDVSERNNMTVSYGLDGVWSSNSMSIFFSSKFKPSELQERFLYL